MSIRAAARQLLAAPAAALLPLAVPVAVLLPLAAPAAAILPLAAPAAAQAPAGYEYGPFELYVRRLPERPIVDVLVDSAGAVYIPVTAVLGRVGIPFRLEPATAAVGPALVLEWPPAVWRTTLRLGDGVVSRGGATDTIAVGELVVAGGEAYLSAGWLSRLLGAEVAVDWPGLAVRIEADDAFPAIARLETESRRARERRAAAATAGIEAPYPARTGGFAGSWGGSVIDTDGLRRGSLHGTAAAGVLGGGLEMGSTLTFGTGIGHDFRDRYIRYSRAFPHDRLVRRLEVGNVFSTSAAARRLRGITLSNEPVHTPIHFGDALIAPQVPAGWEYEVYHGERLVGIAGADDPGIHTPLNYGRTPVRVRLVGPAGQESTERLVFVVPAEQVPAGETRWFAGGGDCEDTDCWDYGYAEARYGIGRALTIGAGADRVTLEQGEPARWRALSFLGLSPVTNLSLQLQHRAATFFLARGQWVAGRASVNADYAWHRPEGDEPISPGWQASLSGAFFPPALGGRSLTARARVRGVETGAIDSWQADVSTSLRGAYLTIGWEAGLQRRDMLTLRTHTQPGSFLDRRLADLALSTTAAVSAAGAELFEAAFSVRPARALMISATLRTRDGGRPTIVLGLVSRLPTGYAQYRVSGGGTTTQFLSADGGAALDAPWPPLLMTSNGVGQAGITGRVFHDVDADGRFGPGDSPAAGAVVSVRGEPVVAGDDGRFRLWHIEPYDAIAIAVDSFSIDPGWTPTTRRTVIRTTPNLFNVVALPLVRTRELAGAVRPPAGRPDAGGIAVEILDDEANVVVTTRTFRDGEYYIQRIRPGRYTARVAAASLAALGVEPGIEPVAFDVPAAGSDVIRIPPIVLR